MRTGWGRAASRCLPNHLRKKIIISRIAALTRGSGPSALKMAFLNSILAAAGVILARSGLRPACCAVSASGPFHPARAGANSTLDPGGVASSFFTSGRIGVALAGRNEAEMKSQKIQFARRLTVLFLDASTEFWWPACGG